MLNFSGSLKVFVAIEACDMRRSFNGLHDVRRATAYRKTPAAVQSSPLPTNAAILLKILYWDGTGLWVLAKRLERGTYSWPLPADAESGKLRLNTTALALLLDGIDMRDGCRRPWYQLDDRCHRRVDSGDA